MIPGPSSFPNRACFRAQIYHYPTESSDQRREQTKPLGCPIALSLCHNDELKTRGQICLSAKKRRSANVETKKNPKARLHRYASRLVMGLINRRFPFFKTMRKTHAKKACANRLAVDARRSTAIAEILLSGFTGSESL